MSWADRVEQVLRLIDEVVRGGTAPVATGPVAGATPAGTTARALGRGSSWAS